MSTVKAGGARSEKPNATQKKKTLLARTHRSSTRLQLFFLPWLYVAAKHIAQWLQTAASMLAGVVKGNKIISTNRKPHHQH